MGHRGDVRTACRVIPGASVPQRKHAGVEFRAAGLAHGLAEVGAVEGQALLGQCVDVGRLCILSTIQGKIVEGAVIGDDDQEIGFSGRACSAGKKQHGDDEKAHRG